MKKMVKICLMGAIILSFAACGENKKPANDDVVVNQPGISNSEDAVQAPNDETVEPNETVKPEQPAEKPVETVKPEQPAEKPVETVKPEQPDNSGEGTTVTMETLINKLVETANLELRMPFTMAIEADRSSEYIGLSKEDFEKYVTDSAVLESMISPSNYSLCLIKINDTSKAEEIKKSIFDNCNPRKWICMGAEYVMVTDCGDCIMLAMAEKDTCTSLKDALSKELNVKTGTVLEKTVE